MKYTLYRTNGEVFGEYEIDCNENAKDSIKKRLAVIEHLKNSNDLNHADLEGADLSHADLRHADLSHADLCWANLRHADLCWVNLRHADLRHADLRDVDLFHVDLREVDLTILQLGLWTIYIQSTQITIGCQRYTPEEWFNFSDAEIKDMHPKALTWWKKWKPIIKSIYEAIK